MNRQTCDIMNILNENTYINQRKLAEISGYSLGIVNKAIHTLNKENYLDKDMQLTAQARALLDKSTPHSAIILAAGYGMRMVPINMETPKAFLEIHGERLIERLIRQLHEVDIQKIYVVVGFMKEQFEYLIDDYGVELVVNSEYASKNNLYSLARVQNYLAGSYIVPCDIWCKHNPFQRHEFYSWYMVSDEKDPESSVRVNRKMELTSAPAALEGNRMIGICYLAESQADIVRENMQKLVQNPQNDGLFWEETLYIGDRMIVQAKLVHEGEIVEINTYEQLRELDSESNQLKSDAISVIEKVFNVPEREITDISVLKKGMTNRSFLFSCQGKNYIMRIPGEGTDQMINRAQEAEVYHILSGKNICDNIIYINPENGYKITEYLHNTRVCNPMDQDDVIKCMKRLRKFHSLKLKVNHEFNIFNQIEFYESLWGSSESIYRDYEKTKEKIFSLREYIDKQEKEYCLTHIDAVPDNFLFVNNGTKEEIRLIDWEYAGMQDPHVDIAMFCIYSLYNKDQIDDTISAYFDGKCPDTIRLKIYCYIAACGLLWSNWCEYKRRLGVEFGEYSLRQYRYAKDYYKIVMNEIEHMEGR